MLLLLPVVRDLVRSTHTLGAGLGKGLPTLHDTGVGREVPGVSAVEVATCGATILLHHLVVHDLVVGRVGVHRQLVDLPSVITAAPHPRLGSLEERLLRVVGWLRVLVHSQDPQPSWILLV